MRKCVYLLCLILMPLSLLAEGAFVRITRAEEITENGEYVVVAVGTQEYPGVYELATTRNKAGNYVANRISTTSDVPNQLELTEKTMVWRVGVSGGQVFLRIGDKFLQGSNSAFVLADSAPTLWGVEANEGRFYLSSGEKYLCASIRNPNLSVSYFGYYSAAADVTKVPNYVFLYRRAESPASMPDYVRYFGAPESWQSICLPFACEVPSDCKAYEVTGRQPDGSIAHSDNLTYLEAGVPYIIMRAHVGVAHFKKQGPASVKSASGWSRSASVVSKPASAFLRGTFEPLHISSGYVLDGKDFVRAATDCIVPPFRAYLP